MWSDLELALALSASEVTPSDETDPLYESMRDLEMKAKYRLHGDFLATCACGATRRLKELLRKPIASVGEGLIVAAKNGHVDCVQLLLLSSPFQDIITAFSEACEQGHKEIIPLLSPRMNSRLEGRIALSRLLPRVCARARFDIGTQLLSLGVTTHDEALTETLTLLCKEWTPSAETFAITLIQRHQAKLTYIDWTIINRIFRQSPVQFMQVLDTAGILRSPLCLPAERWYELMTGGINIEPYLPFGIYPEYVVALTQQARLTMMDILPKDLINAIVMPYLGCPHRTKATVESVPEVIDFSEVEKRWEESLNPKPLPESIGSLVSLFSPL